VNRDNTTAFNNSHPILEETILGEDPNPMSKGIQIAIGATTIALLLGWWGTSQMNAGLSFQYFQDLDAFHASANQMVGRSARVHGYVANASIERDLEGKRVVFSVQNTPPHGGGPIGETLTVVYESLETPDLFKDGAEVVVEGQLAMTRGDKVFEATNLLAKCPSKFEAKVGPTKSTAQNHESRASRFRPND
jgi:cytochrome c-type biogenesis protein CcmE